MTKHYILQFDKRFTKDLQKIPKKDRQKLREKIKTLSEFPRPEGYKKLEGHRDLYRIRSGNYRVVYRIKNKELLILIVQIGHRKDIYRTY